MALPSAIAGEIPTPAETPAESAPSADPTDPRVRRTRQLLQQALAQLLQTREFDKLSVQEITDAAGVNRATFYAHYPDKFALLECAVAHRFLALIASRGIVFDGTCGNALHGIILGVCDFLTQSLTASDCPSAAHLPPHMETAIVSVVRSMLLDGIRKHPPTGNYSPELIAATASWAIYGAAREWARTLNHPPSEEIAHTLQPLINPILHPTS
ncbi:MAG: TetR/AcrR family transcriptional regulator [Acidobacteriaceae bacterium]